MLINTYGNVVNLKKQQIYCVIRILGKLGKQINKLRFIVQFRLLIT
jgi:hypothetical protein